MNKLHSTLRALFLGRTAHDQRTLNDIFSRQGWRLEPAPDLHSLPALARRTGIPVVLCESRLSGGTWRDVARRLRRMANAPHLVVFSGARDRNLWSEVMFEGGFDILYTPFREAQVIWTLQDAFREWCDRPARLAGVAIAKAQAHAG